MRKLVLCAAIAFALIACGATDHKDRASAAPKAAPVTHSSPARPNIVFILTDDMRKDDLRYMPKTKQYLGQHGTTFKNAFISDPVCCPSRATIMRGQYAHNTGVWNVGSPHGGWQTYHANGLERDNVATRLHTAGYKTGLFGKYLNGYNGHRKPPGWDRWYANTGKPEYYNYNMTDGQRLIHYGHKNTDYETYVVGAKAKNFIESSTKSDQPFFAYIAPKGPHPSGHDTTVPAPQDRHSFDGLQADRPPSYNEQNVSDKPPWVRHRPLLSQDDKALIDQHAEGRAEALQSEDRMVADIVHELKDEHALGSTYIFFTSDNGFEMGEHRIKGGKEQIYDESIRTPLLVRGPGVEADEYTGKLTVNTDYFSTWAQIADAPVPDYVDGRSLLPVLRGHSHHWRDAVLLEGTHTAGGGPGYATIRTKEWKYAQFSTGNAELYNLHADPNELSNRVSEIRGTWMANRLDTLGACAGDSCRVAEGE